MNCFAQLQDFGGFMLEKTANWQRQQKKSNPGTLSKMMEWIH
jgi:hypothetical protein